MQLRKALADVAELIYVDAPHLLPLWYRPRKEGGAGAEETQQPQPQEGAQQQAQQQQQQQQHAAAAGVSNSGYLELDWICSAVADDNDDDGERSPRAAHTGATKQHAMAPKLPPCIHKRAWLLSPELLQLSQQFREAEATGAAAAWEQAPAGFIEQQQLERQTEGWDESLRVVAAALEQHAPIDGVLGFSQGAAVATVLCAMQQLQQQKKAAGADDDDSSSSSIKGSSTTAQGSSTTVQGSSSSSSSKGGSSNSRPEQELERWLPRFRFVVLASGFPSPSPSHAALLAAAGPLRLPSLHVFGGAGGRDTAVSAELSEGLANAFDPAEGRRLVRSGGGHDVPRTRPLISAVHQFLVAQRLGFCE